MRQKHEEAGYKIQLVQLLEASSYLLKLLKTVYGLLSLKLEYRNTH